MRVNQDQVPMHFLREQRGDLLIAYDPLLKERIQEVEIDVRRLLWTWDVYLRQFKMK